MVPSPPLGTLGGRIATLVADPSVGPANLAGAWSLPVTRPVVHVRGRVVVLPVVNRVPERRGAGPTPVPAREFTLAPVGLTAIAAGAAVRGQGPANVIARPVRATESVQILIPAPRQPSRTVSESSIVEFGASVSFGREADGAGQARVTLHPDRLVLTGDAAARRVPLDRVFDIAQDISPLVDPDATEAVTVAFMGKGHKQFVSVEGRAETLFRFQHALFRVLLDETPLTIRHTEGGNQKLSRSDLALRVRATRLRATDGDADPVLTIPRDALTKFKSQAGAGDSRPTISLYWRRDGRPAMTTARLPSPRQFNLFGRYLQSPLRMQPPDRDETSSDGPVETLLVDDEPDVLELSEVFLRRQSDRLAITTTRRPSDALALIDEGSFDCVVSDFRMPAMDGVELLQRVRDSHPDLPFILFTGKGSEHVAKRAILDDVTDYVEKGDGVDPYVVLADRIQRAVR